MKIIKILYFFLIFSIAFSNIESSYLDIANELLVRKKLSQKLPDVFDNNKFIEIANNINSIANIDPLDIQSQINFKSIEFQWCYAQAYLLSGNSSMALQHYRKYKALFNKNSAQINELFENSTSELENMLERSQSVLANEIIILINDIKLSSSDPSREKILEVQEKLNTFNEINNNFQQLSVDGDLGPNTKSAIFDFEENNPYFISNKYIDSNNYDNNLDYRYASENEHKTENKQSFSTKVVLSKEKIKTIAGTSIAEILEYVVGINVRRLGGFDASANISTFGGTSEQTLLLVDGLKISNQQTINHDLDLPINIDDIEQIEIYRNPSARSYGSGALSGVINIITKGGESRQTFLATEAGDYSLFNNNLTLALPVGNSFHNFSFSSLESGSAGSYSSNTAFDKTTFFYKYSLKEGKTKTNFSYGYLKRGSQISNDLINTLPRQYETNITQFINSKILWDFGKNKIESNTYWYDHRNSLAMDYNVGSWNASDNTEIGLNFNIESETGNGYRKTDLIFNREVNSNSIISDNLRDNYSIAYQQIFIGDQIHFDFGLSTNYYKDIGWFTSPGYQLSYNINNNANVYHKYDNGFRLPSFYEKYSSDYMHIGNSDLKNERSNAFEYGVQIYGTAIRITASQFYKNSTNVIDWYKINSNSWKTTNIENVLSSGHNLQLELYPELINRLNFFKTIELGYSFLNIDHDGDEINYRNISNYFKHQFIFSTTYNLPFGINRSWYVRYEQPINHDNRIIFDTQLQYSFWRFETTLNINNLFNVQYVDVSNVTLPGRWTRISLRYNF